MTEEQMRPYQKIDGWLLEPAALFTDHLFNHSSYLVRGPAYEIGVYQGKYLSIIYERTLGFVCGYDTFQMSKMESVLSAFRAAFGDTDRLRLMQTKSSELNPSIVFENLGDQDGARFISIDGSHHRADVIQDLVLADKTLAPDGVVAFDDFLNPSCLGVNEAFYRVMLHTDGQYVDMAPFAFITGKLFLCRQAQHSTYYSLGEKFIDDQLHMTWMKKIKAQRDRGISTTYDLVGFNIVRVHG